MDSGNITETEMRYLIEQYSGENVNKVLSTSLLTHPFQMSGSRNHMHSVHYAQHIMINNPETPRNFTGWENQFGKYLNSFEKADANYEIIAKIPRHSSFPDMNYLLVLREMGTKSYTVMKVSHYEKLSDNHGYLRPMTPIDYKRPGARINKDDIVFQAESLDSFGNYRYGRNFKVTNLFIPEVKEDSIVVSKTCAETTRYDLITKTEYAINKNDILCNIYGDLNDYKVLPMVGEDVTEKGILFAVRKMNKKNISADFTSNALMNLYYTDNKFKANGKVIDIDIKVNDLEELENDPHREQLSQLYKDQFRYNSEIVNVLQPIVNDRTNVISDRLEHTLFNAKNYISPNIKYSSRTGNFEFAHITVYTVENCGLTVGSKLTNRCGGKSIVGAIWPDEYMPVDEYGRRADVIICSNGIIGRTNPEQLFDQLISFISDIIMIRMKEMKSSKDAIELMCNYLTDISPEWGLYVRKHYKSKPKKEQDELLQNLYKSPNGIMVYNPPVHNSIGWDKLKEIVTKYDITIPFIRMCKEYNVSKEIIDLYETQGNLDKVENLLENYTFVSEKTKGKKKGEKDTYQEIEFGIHNIDETTNQLKLSKKDYEANKWIDNYSWDDKNEVGIDQLTAGDDAYPDDIVSWINTAQVLDAEWDSNKFSESQAENYKNPFNSTKSRVFKKNDNTLIREFVSSHPVIIGDVYMFVLKQLPDAMFSARSIGSMNPLGLPNKSVKKAEIGKPFGDTPNQISDMETTDLKNLVDPEQVLRFLAIGSTSPELRLQKAGSLLFDDPSRHHSVQTEDGLISNTIPARMAYSYMSALGFELGDTNEEDPYEFLDGVDYRSIPELMKKAGIVPEETV